MDKTFTSLKPRFQSAKVAPGRVTDEPESDMKESNGPMMNKKSTSNHAQSGSRIEKLNVNTRKKGSRNGKTWSDRFKHTIDTYRTELALETERVLAHTEHGLNNQLEQITKEFGGGLKIVAEHEDNIFKPISEEKLEITKSSPEKNGQALKQHVTLAGRMRTFETLVATEATHLEALWKEWHATNLELVCLAIEVLGPDGIELAFNQDDKRAAAQINAAVDASRGHEARHKVVQEQAADMENLVSMNAQETVNSLSEQEKEWKINEKKKIQKIKQIMEAD